MQKIKALFLSILLLLSVTVLADDGDVLTVGDTVPNFVINTTEDGQTINFSDYKGKVVLVNIFATWCGPCKKELPLVEANIWERYKDSTNFALCVFGRGHNWKEINKFKNKNLYDLPMYPDEKEIIFKTFASGYIPRNYIIGKDGKVAYVSVGFTKHDFEEMVTVLNRLLEE